MSNNVNDILKQLDDLNKQTGIDIFIPSLGRTLKFKPLNLRQQKNLLKSSIEETLTKLSFITNFYSILQENIIDIHDIGSLFIFDRTAIAIALRATSLNEEYTVEDNVYNLTDKIKDFVNIQPSATNAIIEDQGLVVNLEIPRLSLDRDISAAVLNKFRAAKTEDAKTVVGELFIHEILKYIKSVTVKHNDGDNTIDFGSLKLESKLAIAEKFPTTTTNQILEFIKQYRDFENQYTKLDDEASIEIDGSFFAI